MTLRLNTDGILPCKKEWFFGKTSHHHGDSRETKETLFRRGNGWVVLLIAFGKPLANFGTQKIHGSYYDYDGPDGRAGLVVVEQVNLLAQVILVATAPDKSDRTPFEIFSGLSSVALVT